MNILSLFDGMSCGQLALKKLGVKVDNYFASEIDKYAMEIAKKNFPNTIFIGDVTKIKGEYYNNIDLLIGGSPCQGFSFAGKQLNFQDERSKLFFEYVRILNEVKPKYFLLENVKMKKEYQDTISEYLFGIQPVEINSALLSAQSRKRLYWIGELQSNGSYKQVEILQPEDKGILLKDILEDKVDEKYNISNDVFEKLRKYESNSRISPLDGKSSTLNTMQGGHRQPKIVATQIGQSKNFGNAWGSDKGYTIKTNTGHGCLNLETNKIRKLTPTECERLQTVPDGYTEGVSNSQRYKMLGNGWTVDIIAHIFNNLLEKGNVKDV